MNTQTQEALKMAIEYLECPTQGGQKLTVINACKEALEQPLTRDWKETIDERIARDSEFKEALEQSEIGDAEIRQMLNDIEYYQKRVEALEQPSNMVTVPADKLEKMQKELKELREQSKKWQGFARRAS